MESKETSNNTPNTSEVKDNNNQEMTAEEKK